jgi:hypothetical protein
VSALVLALILAGLLAAYGPLVAADPLLARDDLHVLARLKGFAGGPREWLVYTPFRDLSFHLDLLARERLGIGTFHLTNLLIWALVVATAWRLLRRIAPRSPRLAAALTLVFALHPVFAGSVSWVAARKHLLAALFLLQATLAFLRDAGGASATGGAARRWRDRLLAPLAYALSLLSHPIGVLWPLWALLHARLARLPRRAGIGPALGLPLMAAGAWLNFVYYRDLYPLHTQVAKFAEGVRFDPGISLLAHGRYLFNLFVPVRLAAVYFPGSLANAAGLLLLPLPFLAARRLRRGREALSWWLFYLVPLLPVTVVMTQVFASDTYLAAGAFGWFAIAALALEGARKPTWLARASGARAALAGAAVLLTALTAWQAVAWRSDAALWARAWAVEPSPRSLELYASQLSDGGRQVEAFALAERLLEWAPATRGLGALYARSLYSLPGIPSRAKLARLQALPAAAAADPWVDYYRAALHAELGEPAAAWAAARRALREPARFGDALPVAVAEAVHHCRRAGGGAECDATALRVRAACARATGPERCEWDEPRFAARLAQLGS